MPEAESLEQDRRYSFLLVIIGTGAILYGTLALLTQRAPSPLLLFDPILGAALVAAGVFWGPFARHRETAAKPLPIPPAETVEALGRPVSPPAGARMEPPPIWLEDLEPPLADSGAPVAMPVNDGVLLELEKIRVDSGRRKGTSAAPDSSGST